MTQYLYRALRDAEIQAGSILIPKQVGQFIAHPRLPITLPFRLGHRLEHAIREHQWNGQYETCGVSTTPHYRRAQIYAARLGVIVKIDATKLDSFGIAQFRIADYIGQAEISVPEDDEVILVSATNCFPREIIAEVILFRPDNKLSI